MLVDLTTTPFPEVLLRLSAERRSGDLVVRAQRVVKTVFFDRGRLVFAASNLRKDRLGEALVALGRITDEQFRKASLLMSKNERRRRFGEALVDAAVMDPGELGTAVARQVRRIVVSLFSLPGAVASFDDRACPIPVEYMVALSLHQLIYVGVKSMSDERPIRAGLGDLKRKVGLAGVPPFRFPAQRCTAMERDILEQARRAVPLEQLASIDGTLTPGRLRAVYALVAAGVLEEPAAEPGPAPVVQADTGSFLMSTLQREPEPSQHEALRLEVEQELARSARLDLDAWFAVATAEQVARALEEKMDRYHAMLEQAGADTQLRNEIEQVLGRAFSALRMAKARSSGKPAPTPGPPAVKAAAARVVPAEIAAVSKATPPVPSVKAKPADPRQKAAAADPKPSAPKAPVANEQPTMLDAERALREGDVRMAVSDYASAVNSYATLVELLPDVPAYRLKLAIAMACWPRTAKQAERQFLEALRLKPNDAHLHYQFGLYYKAMKQRARALTEMRTAFSLDPRHIEVRKELEALSPKDTALTSLKKLFR